MALASLSGSALVASGSRCILAQRHRLGGISNTADHGRLRSVSECEWAGLRHGAILPGRQTPNTFKSIADVLERGNTGNGISTMKGTGKFFVGGNWKCNLDRSGISQLVSDLNAAKVEPNVDVVVSPPFVYIDQVLQSISSRYQVSAQNCWVGKNGAFTGEVSADMLADIGLPWVILGHSERRQLIGESSDFVGQKVAYALGKSLSVIACIGETLREREQGFTFDVIATQLKSIAAYIKPEDWADVVVAYEPVWAIGTGVVASPAQAQEVHAFIRKWLKDAVSPQVSSATRILYGGSVNPGNCLELSKQEDIDGFLVGGASLKGADFAAIINSVVAKKVTA